MNKQQVAKILSIVVMIVGTMVMFGWFLDIPTYSSSATSFQNIAKNMSAYYNMQWNVKCAQYYAATNEEWKCFHAQYMVSSSSACQLEGEQGFLPGREGGGAVFSMLKVVKTLFCMVLWAKVVCKFFWCSLVSLFE